MKRVLVVLAMGFASVGLAAWATDDAKGLAGGKLVAERTVFVPKDRKPFKVEEKPFKVEEKGQIVRLTGKGIAGATITAKVTGPAKITAEGNVVEVVDGKPVYGPRNREFEITPTGKGKVTVVISTKNPTGDNPKDAKYEFEVE